MGIKQKAEALYNDLPQTKHLEAMDYFIEILVKNNAVVTGRNGRIVDWELNPDHKEIKKITKRQITSIDQLNADEKKKYEKRKRILSERWKAKAQKRMLMGIKTKIKSKVDQLEK